MLTPFVAQRSEKVAASSSSSRIVHFATARSRLPGPQATHSSRRQQIAIDGSSCQDLASLLTVEDRR